MTWPTTEELRAWMKVAAFTSEQQAAADLLLPLAVGTAQRVARQTFDVTPDDQAQLRGTWGPILQLPERPVTAVTAVAIEDVPLDVDADVRWDRMGRLKRLGPHVRPTIVPNFQGTWGGPHATVHVTYSHGGAVPDAVRRIVLASAARGVVNPGGRTQLSVGNYSESYGRGAVSSGFTEFEVELLKGYRPRS